MSEDLKPCPLEVMRTYIKGNFTLDLDKAATQALWDECQRAEDMIREYRHQPDAIKAERRRMVKALRSRAHEYCYTSDGLPFTAHRNGMLEAADLIEKGEI